MWKLLIVSDTHGEYELLNKIIKLENPNKIIHCGDHLFTKQYLLKNNILFVKGNNDTFGKDFINLKIDNINIIVTHGHKNYSFIDWHYNLFLKFNEYNPNIIIYGHSHIETIDKINDVYIINPGSLNYPRNSKKIKTYIILKIQNDQFNIYTKYLKEN